MVRGLEEHVRGKLGTISSNRTPGYVALAVASPLGTFTREVETGLGENREANMVAFTVETLTLVRDVIREDAEL